MWSDKHELIYKNKKNDFPKLYWFAGTKICDIHSTAVLSRNETFRSYQKASWKFITQVTPFTVNYY